ncbi:UNVERIFIED_CONTAM: hypothetical protein GTU68_012421 [Idotea baltica]|nr:hypothetical protein [Idotea baltica]
MVKPTIYIINGPNLNLLGRRQPDIYGDTSFDDYLLDLRANFDSIDIHYYQSNHEGDLIDKLHAIGFKKNLGVILNAGAYTHTSIALGDAVASIDAPIVEVHISDIAKRENFRHHSFIQSHAVHFIKGKGLAGYQEGINYLLEHELT